MTKATTADHPITPVADRSTVRPHAGEKMAEAAPGAAVEVLSTFSGRWVNGFTMVEVSEQGCKLRRRSDHTVLPVWFAHDEVRTVAP